MDIIMPILEGAWRYLLTLRVSDYLDIALMAYGIYWLLKIVGTSKVESVGKVVLLFLLALMLSDALSLGGIYFILSHVLSLGALALIVLFLYAAAIIAAPVFLGFFLGALLWRGAMKKAPCCYAELAIGILVWRVAASVPGLSFVVGLVSVPLGLGVVTLLLGKGAAKPSPKAETACEESAASDPAALPEDSDSAEQ